MTELTLNTLEQVTRGRIRRGERLFDLSAPTVIGQIATDSRHVLPGDVFWALSGERHDGASFIAQAFARGAAGVVTQNSGIAVPADRWLLEVDDSLAALTRVASWKREQFNGQVVAITGSVGKSSTREMLNSILRQRLVGVASPRSFNNQLGLPLSMLELAERMDYALFELGASHGGEIAQLAELCQPQIGIITGIGDAHFGEFGGYEAIAAAKCELLARLAPGGLAILNADCDRLRRATAGWCGRKFTFGRSPDADVRATDVEYNDGRLSFCVAGEHYEVPAWGRHQLTVALAAIAGAKAFGISRQEIRDGLAAFEPLAHRSTVRQIGEFTVIDDCYNASPMAMQAALGLLRETTTHGRKIAVLGDMLELGDSASSFHRLLGDLVVTQSGADVLIACGEFSDEVAAAAQSAGMRADRVHCCTSVETAWQTLQSIVKAGDAVLVKASRAVGLEKLIAALEAEHEFAHAHTTNHESTNRFPTPRGVTRTFGAPSLVPSLREPGTAHPPG